MLLSQQASGNQSEDETVLGAVSSLFAHSFKRRKLIAHKARMPVDKAALRQKGVSAWRAFAFAHKVLSKVRRQNRCQKLELLTLKTFTTPRRATRDIQV